MKFAINSKVLIALSAFVGCKDERKRCLDSIYVKVEHGQMDVVGTCGKILGKFSKSTELPDFSAIIPIEMIAFIKKYDGTVEFEIRENSVQVSFNNQNATFGLIEARYPEYNRIIPKDTNSQSANYDVDLLNMIVKANKSVKGLNPSHVKINHNGTEVATFGLNVDVLYYTFIGVLMPLL